jgi:hypothetical protein
MVQNSGTIVPAELRARYARLIADALKRDLGSTNSAAKTLMLWTGASDRSAKYWLAGTKGPGGAHLIMLAKHSDAVMQAILQLTDRKLYSLSLEIDAAKSALGRAAAILDALREQHEVISAESA